MADSDPGCVSASADDNARAPTPEQLSEAKDRAAKLGLTVRGRKNFVLDDGNEREQCGSARACRSVETVSDCEFGQGAALKGRPLIMLIATFQMPPTGGRRHWKQTIIRAAGA